MVSSTSSDSVAEPDLGIARGKHMIFPPLRGGIHQYGSRYSVRKTGAWCHSRIL